MDHVFEAFTAPQLREANADRRTLDRTRDNGLDVTEATFRKRQVGVHQRTDELIAAVACEHVVGPERLSQRQSDLPQEAVTVGVTSGVVDSLQMVDVEKGNDQGFPDSVSPIDRLTQLIAARNA
jgi:hypothetical protein